MTWILYAALQSCLNHLEAYSYVVMNGGIDYCPSLLEYLAFLQISKLSPITSNIGTYKSFLQTPAIHITTQIENNKEHNKNKNKMFHSIPTVPQ